MQFNAPEVITNIRDIREIYEMNDDISPEVTRIRFQDLKKLWDMSLLIQTVLKSEEQG